MTRRSKSIGLNYGHFQNTTGFSVDVFIAQASWDEGGASAASFYPDYTLQLHGIKETISAKQPNFGLGKFSQTGVICWHFAALASLEQAPWMLQVNNTLISMPYVSNLRMWSPFTCMRRLQMQCRAGKISTVTVRACCLLGLRGLPEILVVICGKVHLHELLFRASGECPVVSQVSFQKQ